MAEKKKSCFVIAPIGDEDSDIRTRSDQVLKFVITPAVTQRGYEKPVRADKISEAGVITTQIIEQIVEADLVVADLTGHNANVFYELAIRHAIKKPVILLIEAGEIIPFDVLQNRTIKFNHHDLESVDTCIVEMTKQIKSFEDKDKQIDTPISMTMELKGWRESSNPIEKSNAEIISMIQNLRSEIRELLPDRGPVTYYLKARDKAAENIRIIIKKLDDLSEQMISDIKAEAILQHIITQLQLVILYLNHPLSANRGAPNILHEKDI